MPYKFGALIANEDIAFQYSDLFTIEQTTGADRLCISTTTGHSELLLALAETLNAPFYLLYLLHTPRGPHTPARYQSPALTWTDVNTFIRQFQAFLAHDARHDIWLHAAGNDATLVWERHNLIYAYGPLHHFEAILQQRGFTNSVITIPVPHTHHYHAAFDADEDRVLSSFTWTQSPLQPDDEQ